MAYLITEETLRKLRNSKTEGEWGYIVRMMLLDHDGEYPDDWFVKVMVSGVQKDAEDRWTTIGLGDIVCLLSQVDEGFTSGAVTQVYENGDVDYYRPYIHTADFSMSGSEKGASSVIAYIGTETVRRVSQKNLRLLLKAKSPR